MRKQQQERIGLRGIVADILDSKEKMELDTLDYYTETIFPHEQLVFETMAVLSEAELSTVTRRLINYINRGQAVSLVDFSPEEEDQLLDNIKRSPEFEPSQFIELNLHTMLKEIAASTDSKRITTALLLQFNSQLGTDFEDIYSLKLYLKKNEYIIRTIA